MRSAAPVSTPRRIPGPPRDRVKARLLRLYRALLAREGVEDWWAGLTAARVAAVVICPDPRDRRAARRVQAFRRWLAARHRGRFDRLRRAPLATVRAELRRIAGLDVRTVDAILLYAAHRPVFPADARARRALARHGLGSRVSYEDARAWVEGHLPSDPALLKRFHALLVRRPPR
jgi:endonuclease III-like uncharacterized protein